MICGFVAGSAYLYYLQTGGTPWIGIDHLRFAMIGMPVSLIAMVAVTLMTPAPDEETQRMVDEVRIPTGGTILAQTH
jgi:cation/acetate symporter